MNEWKQLLNQTSSRYSKTMMTVEEAITKEEAPLTETEKGLAEIEWISPTHKLQDKIKNIPDKMAFKIGEAADYVGVKQYVLRYWESEFDILKPKKSKNGQRMYTRKDVETALLIKKLLHEDRFSIEGAQTALRKLRKQVKEESKAAQPQAKAKTKTMVSKGSLEFAEGFLEQIRLARTSLNLD